VAGIEDMITGTDKLTDDDLDGLAPDTAKKSQSDKLVELAKGVEFFHADIDEPFASAAVGDHVKRGEFARKGSNNGYLSGTTGNIKKHQAHKRYRMRSTSWPVVPFTTVNKYLFILVSLVMVGTSILIWRMINGERWKSRQRDGAL